MKAGREFHSHLSLLWHFCSPQRLKQRKVLSLKKLEMADHPRWTNLGAGGRVGYHYSQHREFKAENWLHVCERRECSVCGCQEMWYLTSKAKSAYVQSITWLHASLRASSSACRGEITMTVKLIWWLVQQNSALQQWVQLVRICWLRNKQQLFVPSCRAVDLCREIRATFTRHHCLFPALSYLADLSHLKRNHSTVSVGFVRWHEVMLKQRWV